MGISREQALECLRSDDLIGLGMEADAVRRRLHPEGVATYALGCAVDCAELVLASATDNAEARLDAACARIAEAIDDGATGVQLSRAGAGAVRDGMREFQWLEGMLREMRRQFPSLWIDGFTAAEIAAMASICKLGVRDILARLRDAGLDAIASDGPRLVDGDAAAQWVEIHRAAHGLGMRTSAGMVFGDGETAEQRADFLDAVRAVQDETGGFAAFISEAAPAPNGRQLDSVTAVERLKMLAVARMFLDTIENIQADGVAGGIDGLKVLQTALRFGANDLGMIDVGRRSPNAAAGSIRSEEDLRRIIRDAGLRPAERDAAWRAMMLS